MYVVATFDAPPQDVEADEGVDNLDDEDQREHACLNCMWDPACSKVTFVRERV